MRLPLGQSGEEIVQINRPPSKAHFTPVSCEDLLGEEDVAVTAWNLVMGMRNRKLWNNVDLALIFYSGASCVARIYCS